MKFLYFIFGFILCIILIESIFEKNYLLIKSELKNYLNKKIIIKNSCQIKELKKIEKNSIAIIGHAYDRSSNNTVFLSSKIVKFIFENSEKLDIVIFSGDVFKNPSIKKWQKLINLMKQNNIKLNVAPGNHDVGFGDNSRRDIFNKTFNYEFPINFDISKKYSNLNIILEDSTINNWLISNKTIKLTNLKNKKTFIIRHHVPILELVSIANSLEEVSNNLPDIKSLASKFNKETIIIAGDTGAISNLPRISCQKFNNLTVVANGLGEIEEDKILIISKNKLFNFNI